MFLATDSALIRLNSWFRRADPEDPGLGWMVDVDGLSEDLIEPQPCPERYAPVRTCQGLFPARWRHEGVDFSSVEAELGAAVRRGFRRKSC
jgi:hypothetical protein